MDFEIKAGDPTPVADQVRTLTKAKIDDVLEILGDMSDEPDKTVHRTRKELKKLRGLVRLVRDSMGKSYYKSANRGLRDAGRELAVYRDHAVRLEIVTTLRAGELDPALDKSLESAEGKLADIHARDANPEALQKSADEAGRLLRETRERIDDWPLDEKRGFRIFRHGFARVYSRAYEGLSTSLARPSVGNLHDWRKRCKYLRYHLRLLRGCWPEILDSYEDELHRLTNHLGDDHDLAVLRETLENDLEDVIDRPALATLNELIAGRHRAHIDAVWPLARRLFAEPPEAFVKRIGVYWKSAA